MWIVLRLLPRQWYAEIDEAERQELFGSIVKLEQRLAEREMPVERTMHVASYGTDRLDVRIDTEFYGKPFSFRFAALPQGDNCRIEYEDVEIPARTEKRAKVVCDEGHVQSV